MLTKPRLEDEELAHLVSARPSVQKVSSSIPKCDHKAFFRLLSIEWSTDEGGEGIKWAYRLP